MRERDLILEVFPNLGDTMTKEQAMKKLREILFDENYINEKVAGSLGGAVSGGFLVYDGNVYKRVKEAEEL